MASETLPCAPLFPKARKRLMKCPAFADRYARGPSKHIKRGVRREPLGGKTFGQPTTFPSTASFNRFCIHDLCEIHQHLTHNQQGLLSQNCGHSRPRGFSEDVVALAGHGGAQHWHPLKCLYVDFRSLPPKAIERSEGTLALPVPLQAECPESSRGHDGREKLRAKQVVGLT